MRHSSLHGCERLPVVAASCLLFAAPLWTQQYVISTVAGGAPVRTPAPAVSASLAPARVASDASGNVYFSSYQCIYQVDSHGLLTRIAGIGRRGDLGDGGPALSAQLMEPSGIAIDTNRNIYVAEPYSGRVRKISSDGIVTTAVGTGIRGFSGDGGLATGAQINYPRDVALDRSGNLYIADYFRVRKVTPAGTITTVAGNGTEGYSGDGGPATAARLDPSGVAADDAGNLYIADTSNSRIRKVSPAGIITTVAGTGAFGFSGDGGLATAAQLFYPAAVTVDATGNLYIADTYNNRVRRISPSGIISTFAGAPWKNGFSGDGGPAANAELLSPTGVAPDFSGNVYIVDTLNSRVRKVSAAGVITTIAGNGFMSYSGDGGPATSAQLNFPAGLALDRSNNLYIVDSNNHCVRRVSAAGIITTIAGDGTSGYSGDGGPATSARLKGPGGITVDPNGSIYISDTGNNVIRKVSGSGIITTIAGTGEAGYSGDGGPALKAQLSAPQGLALNAAGDIFFADRQNNRIRKISAGVISTVAGSSGAYLGDGEPATSAALNHAGEIALDGAGNLYIADLYNSRIRKVDSSGIITTVAGTGQYSHYSDCAIASLTGIGEPVGVALDGMGNVFFSVETVREVSPSGLMNSLGGINGLVQSGYVDYFGDGGPALAASFLPGSLAVDSLGNVYVSDQQNNAVRMLHPVGASPALRATNAASLTTGPVAPGEVVTITGCGIGPEQIVKNQPDSTGVIGTGLAGTTVTFNGVSAPVLSTSWKEVSAVVPYALSGDTAQITATYQGAVLSGTVPVTPAAPGIFTANSSGRGQALAVNADGSSNSAFSPARIGDAILLYATGGGPTDPPGLDGTVTSAPLPQLTLPVSVTIGGQPAVVQYAGGAPGIVAGVLQVNAQIPGGIQTGIAVPLLLQVGDATSQTGVTIAVR